AGGMPGAAPGRQGQTGDMGGGPANAPTGRSNVPALNANSRGAIGMPNVTLSPEASPTQGSMISSSRGNVKLDGGTLLVLRVMGQ
ncbi:MAG TPA: hypothetical protein VKT29_15630, partial [Terriglobales bacterium]|nr:hypothetical protein [Terriglobales bacterium]